MSQLRYPWMARVEPPIMHSLSVSSHTIKYDKIFLEMPAIGIELHGICKRFIIFYNIKREHSELGYVSPIKRHRAVA